MSSTSFQGFAKAFAKNFAGMSKRELFRADIDGDTLWQTYLEAFPPGANPIFRVRTTHDGSIDRSVIKRLGNVVAIGNNGDIITAAEASVKRAERQRLEEILHIRKEQDLMQLSPAEIQAKIDALGT